MELKQHLLLLAQLFVVWQPALHCYVAAYLLDFDFLVSLIPKIAASYEHTSTQLAQFRSCGARLGHC